MSIAQLIADVDRLAPEFSSRIRGVDESTADEIHALAGVALPRVYRDYLRRMGADDCGIMQTYAGADMRAASVLRRCDSSTAPLLDGMILIGTADDGFDTYLEAGTETPRVLQAAREGVLPDGATEPSVVAAGLREFLFGGAFANLVCFDFRFGGLGAMNPITPWTAGYLEETLLGQGLVVCEGSAASALHYRGASGALSVVQPPGAGAMVSCYSEEESWIEGTTDLLADTLGITGMWIDEVAFLHSTEDQPPIELRRAGI